MKRIALAAVVLAAAVGAGYAAAFPAEFEQYKAAAGDAGRRAWAGAEANPVPVYLALGTFLLTVGYHAARGKSLRESVAAATHVAGAPAKEDDETPVVRRAKARATRTQLVADQIALTVRLRKLPDELTKAEKESCYTEQAVADAERVLANKQEAHDAAVARLEALREEKAAGDAELAAIDAELKKLAELV